MPVSAPIITSNGGGATAAISLQEGITQETSKTAKYTGMVNSRKRKAVIMKVILLMDSSKVMASTTSQI